MSKLIMAVKYSIFKKGDSPVFGESVTDVELADEGGGPFVIIKQAPNDFGDGGELRFDFEEIGQLVDAVRMLEASAKVLENEKL